jgi:hypothetical protein
LRVDDVRQQLSEGSHTGSRFEIIILSRHTIGGLEKVALPDGIELLQIGDEERSSLCQGARGPADERKNSKIALQKDSFGYLLDNTALLFARQDDEIDV